MNRIKPQLQDFALTSTVLLEHLQEAWESIQSAYALGGGNYILSGCAVNGTNVGSGVLVINGEALPFAGGTANDFVIVTEQEATTTVGAGSYTRVLRSASFGTGAGQIGWGTFQRITRGVAQVGREVRMMLRGRSLLADGSMAESLRVEGCVYDTYNPSSQVTVNTVSAGSVYIPSTDTVYDVPAHEYTLTGQAYLQRWKVTTESTGYQYATLAPRADTEPNTYADNANRF
jgi:hypothetical protein